jgi:hypothetical protein
MSLSFNPSGSSSEPSQPQQYGQPAQPSRNTQSDSSVGRGCLSGFLGFVLFFLLNIVYFLYMSFTISNKPFLLKIGTDTLGAFYDASPDSFASYLIVMKKELEKSAVSQPFPEINIRVSKNEIAGLSDKEIIIFIATNKFIHPIYEKGDAYAEEIFSTGGTGKGKIKSGNMKPMLEKFDYDGEKRSGLYFLTREFHEKIARSFYIFAGICGAIFIIMVLVNTGYWRFSAIGSTLVVSSLPVMSVWLVLSGMISSGEWMKHTEVEPAIVLILTKLIDPFVGLFQSVFLTVLITGVVFIVIAIVFNVLHHAQENTGSTN